jgi:hypothetical protein
MDSKRKASQTFNNNPQGSSIRGRPNNRWWNCAQTDIKKERKKEEKEEEEEEEEGEEEEKRIRRTTT